MHDTGLISLRMLYCMSEIVPHLDTQDTKL